MKKSMRIAFTLAATVVIILGSGRVKSQDKKEIRNTVIISNDDTLINGKKLSDTPPAERKKLLKEFEDMQNTRKQTSGMKGKRVTTDRKIVIEGNVGDPKTLIWRSERNGSEGSNGFFRFDGDSLVVSLNDDSLNKGFRIRMEGLDSNMRKRIMTINRSLDGHPDLIDGSRPGMFIERSEMRNRIASRPVNSQVFNYVSTDKDGISSRMSIRISETDAETLKKLNVETKKALDVSDLTLWPNFSTGKLNLSFNLVDKVPAEVKIMDNHFKPVFTEQTGSVNGTYFKQINLAKNGVYYIVINQANQTYVRKIIKE